LISVILGGAARRQLAIGRGDPTHLRRAARLRMKYCGNHLTDRSARRWNG
jgi:hypothetical protein